VDLPPHAAAANTAATVTSQRKTIAHKDSASRALCYAALRRREHSMAEAQAPSRTSTYVGAALVVAALVVAAITGFSKGSIAGAAIALFAVIPAGVGMWKGMQEKTQAGLGIALLVFLAALATAGVLVVLKIIDWIR
jgi:hypothetical protein